MKPKQPYLLATALVLSLLFLCLWIIVKTPFQSDMGVFMPRHPSEKHALLVAQLKEGVASRLLLVGVDGVKADEADTISARYLETWSTIPGVQFLSNGTLPANDKTAEFVFAHRFLLNDQNWSVPTLAADLQASVATLSGSEGALAAQLMPKDPTLLTMKLARRLGDDLGGGLWQDRQTGRLLFMAMLSVEGSDLDGIEQVMNAMRSSVGQYPIAFGGAPMFAVASREAIRADASRLSTIGSVLIIALLFALFRSLRILLLGLLPVGLGIIAALAAVAAGFGVVHGMTVGFGITLIGEAVDYAIYLLVQGAGGHKNFVQKFWPTIRLGVIVSVIGFTALLFSDFQGLAQLGVFSIAGLIVAAAVTRFVLPGLLPVNYQMTTYPKLSQYLNHSLYFLQGRRRFVLITFVFLLFLAWSQTKGKVWSTDLLSLSPVPSALVQQDQALRQGLPAKEGGHLLVLQGSDEQALLRQCEQLLPTLVALALDYDAPCVYLPSQEKQKERVLQLKALTIAPLAHLQAAIAASETKLSQKAEAWKDFVGDIQSTQARALLERKDLQGTALASALAALIHPPKNKQEQWQGFIHLRTVPTEVQVVQLNTAHPKTQYLAIKNESDALYARYFSEAVKLALFGFLAIAVLLIFTQKSLSKTTRVLLPLVLAALFSLLILSLLGQSLNLLHVIGAMLVVAVGSNYALYFNQDEPITDSTLMSLVVANATTILGFGLLAFSQVPVLKALGSTVGLGAFLALLLSAVYSPKASKN